MDKIISSLKMDMAKKRCKTKLQQKVVVHNLNKMFKRWVIHNLLKKFTVEVKGNSHSISIKKL
jgi:hypothetical protein